VEDDMKKATKGEPKRQVMKMLPDVQEALMIARARTRKPMWQIADEALRKALGLSPREA
jgi:hypothetical protein